MPSRAIGSKLGIVWIRSKQLRNTMYDCARQQTFIGDRDHTLKTIMEDFYLEEENKIRTTTNGYLTIMF
jgi:hypothetical protein